MITCSSSMVSAGSPIRTAPQVDDGFGGVNSRISLVPPDAPRL